MKRHITVEVEFYIDDELIKNWTTTQITPKDMATSLIGADMNRYFNCFDDGINYCKVKTSVEDE